MGGHTDETVTVPDQKPRRRTNPLALGGILAGLVVGAFLAHWGYGLRNHFYDLMVYRDAMRWWNDGNFLYDFWQPDATQGRLEFTYPPFAAELLRPLGWLTEAQAAALFVLTTLGSLAVTVWLLVRPLADRYAWPRWFTFGVAFVLMTGLEPIRHTFDFGQINAILWLLIVVDLLVLATSGSRFAGVGIGVATAIKLVPGIFILYLLVARRWRAAGVATGTAVLATGLAAALAPRESWSFWTERVLHGEGVGRLDYAFNQSLMGLLARLAAPAQPNPVIWLALALPLLVVGLWRAGRAAAAGDHVAGLTIAGLTGALVSPVTWVHHIFWFVPAIVVLVAEGLGPPGGTLRARLGPLVYASVIYVTATVSVVALWNFELGQPGGFAEFVLSNWFFWLMLSLLVFLPIRPPVHESRDLAPVSHGNSRPSKGR